MYCGNSGTLLQVGGRCQHIVFGKVSLGFEMADDLGGGLGTDEWTQLVNGRFCDPLDGAERAKQFHLSFLADTRDLRQLGGEVSLLPPLAMRARCRGKAAGSSLPMRREAAHPRWLASAPRLRASRSAATARSPTTSRIPVPGMRVASMAHCRWARSRSAAAASVRAR